MFPLPKKGKKPPAAKGGKKGKGDALPMSDPDEGNILPFVLTGLC